MSRAQRPLQFVQVLTALTVLILAWPVTITCSAPFQTCTPPPNDKGEIVRPITVEPYLIVLLEKWLQIDLALAYKTDTVIDRPVTLPDSTVSPTSQPNEPLAQ